ncbi:MAG: SusC/RagA family TonB-linked outer membrane protein [Cellulophaga sp.]|uniref:SusC/RagA family TonB-linked outer membrane protein n=1 Tax=unclassified Cellulophaga TaxID=2634405 RepID=UPI0026E1EC88|nr:MULTISPECIES: TonB-dependent receptor [unclassified Cellulophaga]MDO6491259.1 TonB-dependent receptor [Cellulophaga sp. 2_MG-2023]MDO6495208.1 TonB-dependent receptor [Cellulophaga sp. 3_MG-2023]
MKYEFQKSMIFIVFLIFSFYGVAQIKVTGTVKSNDGVPLLGVTIMEQGSSTNGTTTDFDGNFALEVDSAKDVLVISYIGFVTKTISIPENKNVSVILEEDLEQLSEVVVVGYGSVKKSDVTGSVTSVEMDNIPSKPANSIDGLLQGQVAGVQVTTPSDNPGAGAVIRIRGGSSLRGGNDPLVVVDGFPIGYAGDLKQISPQDIASMEVLKDASASAIYGSRGANGVIMITTKKGAKHTTEVTVSQQNTYSSFTSDLNLWRDPVLMAELSNESRTNGGFTPIYIGAKDANGVYYPSVSELKNGSWAYNTRWDDVVFRDPVSNNTNIAVRSQTDRTQFSLSTTYYTNEGVYINNDYEKLNINLNVIHKIYNDKVTIGGNVIYSKGNQNNNNDLAYWRNPIFPIYEDGNPINDYFLAGSQDYSHPIALVENRTNKNEFLDFIGSAFIEIDFTKTLKLKTQVNHKYGRSITDYYNPKIYTQDGTFNNGSGGVNNWENTETVAETFLTYNNTYGNKHNFTAMGGFSYQGYEARTSDLKAYDFLNESLGNGNLAAGNPEKQSVANGLSETVMYSGIGRLNYGYDDKYLATFTVRTDGSSKFGENNQWALFPSGALGWKIHKEDFIRNLNVFDEFKLRASYGISGNQGISPYLINSRYGQDQYYVNGRWQTTIGPGYVVGQDSQSGKKTWGGIPNPDLKWETTEQFNIGADVAFFNNRLKVTADYYKKHTSDLLRERLLSPSSSYDKMWVNDGEIENQGVEVTIDGTMVNKEDWGLNGMFIFSRNKNKVVSLGDAVSSGLNTDALTGIKYEFSGNQVEAFRAIPNILAVGQPINVFYGYKVDGIVQSRAQGLAAGLTGDLAEPGEFKYVDLNEDGVIDENDRTIIGNPNPDFIASLNLNGRYKNFDFSLFFNGSFGQDIFNTKAFSEPGNTPLRWTQDNTTNNYPSLRDGRTLYMSDYFIEKGSFVRLQNLSIGYNITNLNTAWFKKGRIFMNGTNLFTITDFNGYDPELGGDGIYWGGYPKLRNWTLGVELTF